jgi:2'-5' RNA ligase
VFLGLAGENVKAERQPAKPRRRKSVSPPTALAAAPGARWEFQVLNPGRRTAKVKPMSEDNPSAFLRLFIALAVPLAVRKEIGRAQSQLQRATRPGVIRWTRPEQFHVTLKFLGDVPSEQVAALEQSVARVCSGFQALRLSAQGIGFFPGAQKPRVIWAGIDDDNGQLSELYRKMDEAVQPFAPAGKPERFAGHITLGRFKPGRHAAVGGLLERATVLRERHFGDWPAGEVEIVRSELTSTGARHTPLATFPLSG